MASTQALRVPDSFTPLSPALPQHSQQRLEQHQHPPDAGMRSVRGARVGCVSRRPALHICRTSKFEAGNEFADELRETAKYIATPGKGILASDESNATTGKRLATVDVENTEDNRRAWRQTLYTAPGLGEYISGAAPLLFTANGSDHRTSESEYHRK